MKARASGTEDGGQAAPELSIPSSQPEVNGRYDIATANKYAYVSVYNEISKVGPIGFYILSRGHEK